MNSQDLNPLDYQTPGREPVSARSGGSGQHFFFGLAIGSVASLIYWTVAWTNNGWPAALWGILVVKLVAATVFSCLKGKHAIGAGLFVSLIVGFMIFFSVCAANFKI